MLANYIELMRVRCWVKNLLLFLPLFFAGRIADITALWQLGIGFVSFSLFTSFVYIFNDIQDVHTDRHHPLKRNRPIANHSIKSSTALSVAVGCLLIGMALSFMLPIHFLWLAGLYVIINVLYSVSLKKMSIINLFIPPLGYIIRVYAGGLITHSYVSVWVVLLIFLLTLIFTLLSRREDVLLFVNESAELNRSVRGYSLEFLNLAVAAIAGAFLVCYTMFCLSPGIMMRYSSVQIYLSLLPVIAGLLRYIQLVVVKQQPAEPVDLLINDGWLQMILLSWIIFFTYVIYFP